MLAWGVVLLSRLELARRPFLLVAQEGNFLLPLFFFTTMLRAF
jgi:hypothetical protein